LRGLEFNARLSVGAVTLTHCTSGPVEGRQLGEAQIGVAIHDGAAFDMDWRGGESDRLRSSTVSRGRVHVRDGRLPFWVRCNASASFFAFAIEESFVTEIWRKGFDGIGDCFIGTSIGVEDPVIGRLAALGRIELNEGGAGGRLYVEGLASALAVHLLRSSGLSRRSPIPHKGGLARWQVRRVLEYIEAHLNGELGLVELAAIVELSPHYFGEAFRISTGSSPHRYVMERRVERARDLLWDADRPILDIAYAAGFSSQSHFTANFRRVTGVTPRRFRRSLP
jgi:AraC family transcriptional regulator